MTSSRRGVLALASALLLPGCLLDGPDGVDDPLLTFVNRDSASHVLKVGLRGSGDDEVNQEFEVTLEPDEDQRASEPVRYDLHSGQELVVITRIDGGSREEHHLTTGFSSLDVIIEADESIGFSSGTA